MNIRNAQTNRFGGIDCEIGHPAYGWIPFTASPDDPEPHGREIFAAVQSTAAPFPGVPLSEVKAASTRAIEAARDAACVADVSVNGKAWQADERSQRLLSSAITLGAAGLPLPASWRAKDNSNIPVAALADLLPIAAAMAAQTQAAYEKSWTLKAQIEAATTAAEVEAVQW